MTHHFTDTRSAHRFGIHLDNRFRIPRYVAHRRWRWSGSNHGRPGGDGSGRRRRRHGGGRDGSLWSSFTGHGRGRRAGWIFRAPLRDTRFHHGARRWGWRRREGFLRPGEWTGQRIQVYRIAPHGTSSSQRLRHRGNRLAEMRRLEVLEQGRSRDNSRQQGEHLDPALLRSAKRPFRRVRTARREK